MKFKVGDKVKVIAGRNKNHEFSVGEIVEIVDIDPYENRYPYGCVDKMGESYRWVSKNDIEPVSEYPKEMLVTDYKGHTSRQVIVAYVPELEHPYLRKPSYTKDVYTGYKYAKDLPQPKEVTMQEIADKFGINVEQLKIKK